MSFPIYRFTLSNTIEGDYVISEPGGWDDAEIKLERNEKYHSLVEFYDQPLTFYGSNGNKDGGLEYIRNIEATQGADADITITVEVNFGSGYETLFEGLLDLSQIREVDFYKADIPIIRSEFWSKFINKSTTPVDLLSTVDLYGGTPTFPTTQSLILTNQQLNRKYTARYSEIFRYGTGLGQFGQIDFDSEQESEINVKYNYPRVFTANRPGELFAVEFAGDYVFDISIYGFCEFTGAPDPINALGPYYNVVLQINDGALINLTETTDTVVFLGANYNFTHYTYTGTQTLEKGDFIYLYLDYISNPVGLDVSLGGDTGPLFTLIGQSFPSTIEITAKTEYPTTTANAFLVHDVGNAILDRITGNQYSLYSDYFGGTLIDNGESPSYTVDGCGFPYVLLKGLQIRGYNFPSKPFSLSFDDFWKGVDPIFCLGLGYEGDKIRIEKRDFFYDSSTDSVLLSNVNNIERSYLNERIYKKIEIGYQKWESENVSGIDDPQTKHTYSTDFKKIGEDLEIYSKFMAASYAIESTRRQTLEKSKDYRLDNDVFIINVDTSDTSFLPVLDENFSSVTGLLNSDTRYNIGLSPKYNFYKWVKALAASFKPLNVGLWRFTASEGNVDMVSNTTDPCTLVDGLGDIGESDNVSIADLDAFGVLHGLEVWEFEHPLDWETYKTIRANREKSIGVSQTSTGHESFFILSLEYQITKSKSKFKIVKA